MHASNTEILAVLERLSPEWQSLSEVQRPWAESGRISAFALALSDLEHGLYDDRPVVQIEGSRVRLLLTSPLAILVTNWHALKALPGATVTRIELPPAFTRQDPSFVFVAADGAQQIRSITPQGHLMVKREAWAGKRPSRGGSAPSHGRRAPSVEAPAAVQSPDPWPSESVMERAGWRESFAAGWNDSAKATRHVPPAEAWATIGHKWGSDYPRGYGAFIDWKAGAYASDAVRDAVALGLATERSAARGEVPARGKRSAPKVDLAAELEGLSVGQRRRKLRMLARERQSDVIPALREAIKGAKKHRRDRLKACASQCKARKARLAKAADNARAQLRVRIDKLKETTRAACKSCRVTKPADLDRLEALLGQLDAERHEIARLRRLAAHKSEHGKAGGKRSAELRAESDEEVQRNIGDDPLLLAAWDKYKRTIKPAPHRTRSEAFLEWVHDNPGALAEVQAATERQYDQEAEAMLKGLRGRKSKTDRDLEAWHEQLSEAENLLSEVPF